MAFASHVIFKHVLQVTSASLSYISGSVKLYQKLSVAEGS